MPPDAESTSRSSPKSRFRVLAAIAAGIAGAVFILAGALSWSLYGIHFPSLAEVTSRRVIELKSADGRNLFPSGQLQLAPIPVKEMPAVVVDAVLSIEDRRFYEHGGLDLSSVARAFKENLGAGRIVAGGSTITQQLVKTLFLGPKRTYRRKIREAAISFWLERHLTKDQILTSYLNNVYLGSGATGIPAAAKIYFDKKVADLDLSQAAMLAGMINSPGEDDPFHDLNAARRRAATVLDAMVANGKLTAAAALAAKLHPATPVRTEVALPATGWFVGWINSKAAGVIPADAGTVQMRTTLDLRLQQLAATIVKSTLAKYGAAKHVSEAALVAMRPDGAVVAMIGGRSFGTSQYNRAVQAERQPGSAFKLFDYYAALRQGFTPDDRILDAPVDVHGWHPENYGHRSHGEVTLASAFADSLNDATVRLSQEVGIKNVIAAARDLGLRAKLQDTPSLALGTSEVTLLDLTSAYAAVRAGKAPVVPRGIGAIKTANDPDFVTLNHPSGSQHSLGSYQADLIELLQGVVDHGTGRAAALNGFAAGKTGTTQDYRDAWFIGFDDSLVVGVWVGNDDHSPMKRVVGGSLPAKIWKEFMERANTPAVAETNPDDALDQEDGSPSSSEMTQNTRCNVPACEAFYHSFRASDCTYQPYWGGRQVCER